MGKVHIYLEVSVKGNHILYCCMIMVTTKSNEWISLGKRNIKKIKSTRFGNSIGVTIPLANKI